MMKYDAHKFFSIIWKVSRTVRKSVVTVNPQINSLPNSLKIEKLLYLKDARKHGFFSVKTFISYGYQQKTDQFCLSSVALDVV